VEKNDDFVRVDHVEILAQQFTSKVGIHAARIEQRDPVAQLITLSSNGFDLGLPRIKKLAVFAPGDNPAGAKKGQTCHHQQTHQRKPFG